MRNQAEPWNFAAIKPPITQEALDHLFCEAPTHSTWLPEPVPVELLRKPFTLAPGIFVRKKLARKRLVYRDDPWRGFRIVLIEVAAFDQRNL
jgi:hypothetical protein